MDARRSSLLSLGTLFLSCASSSHQRPAFILHQSQSHALKCSQSPFRPALTIRMSGDVNNDDSNNGDQTEDDEALFQRRNRPSHNFDSLTNLHDDEEEDELQKQLNKISWLPSLQSTRKRSTSSRSRTENLQDNTYNSSEKTQILPILPLQMLPNTEHTSGVWPSTENNNDFASPAYLPHTGNHILSIASPRYKKLYDDLLNLGEYWGEKRSEALREARMKGIDLVHEEDLPNPEEKRRFIVTVMHPHKEGVMAEYGVLFQLKDLDEVAAVAGYDDEMIAEEIEELMEDVDDVVGDFADVLLDTHYEATHDVVGRVRIRSVVNPECWDDVDEEYLMGEATVIDLTSRQSKGKLVSTKKMTVATQLEAQAKQHAAAKVADAVSRIRDELRSAVDESFVKQQSTTATTAKPLTEATSTSTQPKNQIPLVPKGIQIERHSDESLIKEENALRGSFSKLVALQQELKETFRFTRDSVKSFGVGSIGMWLSAAAWSKFIDKRLEGANMEMQSELQSKLLDYLSELHDNDNIHEHQQETIDYDDLSPELQNEFTLLQARAADELGPASLERSIQMQCIIQAESDADRLKLLKECVDAEISRLQAKKMLQLAVVDYKDDGGVMPTRLRKKEVRDMLEKLVEEKRDYRFPEDAFQ